MRLLLLWLLPDLLTSKLAALSEAQTHWLARKAGIYAGMHEFLAGLCPCSVDLDLGDEDLEQVSSA